MVEDDRFAQERSHATAMAMRSLTSAITDLHIMHAAGDLSATDIQDIELSYDVLGRLLDRIKSRRVAA
jgi:hypothetical protein